MLEVLVGVEAQGADDADDGGGTGLEPAGHVTDIEENKLAGGLEHGAVDFARPSLVLATKAMLVGKCGCLQVLV